MSRRGKPSEGQTPNFISKRVTMLSDAISAFLDDEAFLRAVLTAVSRSITVALASAIEHALPCLMWDAHRRAAAILFILERDTRVITSCRKNFGLNQSRICSSVGASAVAPHSSGTTDCTHIASALDLNEYIVGCYDCDVVKRTGRCLRSL